MGDIKIITACDTADVTKEIAEACAYGYVLVGPVQVTFTGTSEHSGKDLFHYCATLIRE